MAFLRGYVDPGLAFQQGCMGFGQNDMPGFSSGLCFLTEMSGFSSELTASYSFIERIKLHNWLHFTAYIKTGTFLMT
jgi:hypothetical protein